MLMVVVVAVVGSERLVNARILTDEDSVRGKWFEGLKVV